MFKFLLQGENINWMAVFGLITFVILFVVIVLVTFFRDSTFIQKMAQLPLDEDSPKTSQQEQSPE